MCTCPTGFTGVNCEVNIDDCKNVSCLNGGKCIDLINTYVCQCPVTHKGVHCEKSMFTLVISFLYKISCVF